MANLKTKEAVANINNTIIPDVLRRLGEANPLFRDLKISVDTDSFGNDFTELSYVYSALSNVYDGIQSLHDRSDVAKEELEAQLKKISLKLTPDVEQKVVTFKKGELTVSTNSFNNNYVGSSEIIAALEDAL